MFAHVETAVRSKLKAATVSGGATGTVVYAHYASDLLESLSIVSTLVRLLNRLVGVPQRMFSVISLLIVE